MIKTGLNKNKNSTVNLNQNLSVGGNNRKDYLEKAFEQDLIKLESNFDFTDDFKDYLIECLDKWINDNYYGPIVSICQSS